MKNAIIGYFVLLVLLEAGCKENKQPENISQDYKIMLFTDPHYMDPSLIIKPGLAFTQAENWDIKLFAESPQLFDAVQEKVLLEKPDLLLISGDLTKDGEVIDHQKVVERLERLKNLGINTLVIPGNHDINNFSACNYDGDKTHPVPYILRKDFPTYYNDFGYKQAIARDTASVSYVAEPLPGVRIIALDAIHIMKDVTLNWAVEQIKKAKSENKIILGMMHYGIVEHFTNEGTLDSTYIIKDFLAKGKALSDAGLRIVFTGHSHTNDITASNFNNLVDVETGSLITWPCPYRTMFLSHNTLTVHTTYLSTVPYAYDKLKKHFYDWALLEFAKMPFYIHDAGQRAFGARRMMYAELAHFHGNENIMSLPNEADSVNQLQKINPLIYEWITYLWTDLPPDDAETVIPF